MALMTNPPNVVPVCPSCIEELYPMKDVEAWACRNGHRFSRSSLQYNSDAVLMPRPEFESLRKHRALLKQQLIEQLMVALNPPLLVDPNSPLGSATSSNASLAGVKLDTLTLEQMVVVIESIEKKGITGGLLKTKQAWYEQMASDWTPLEDTLVPAEAKTVAAAYASWKDAILKFNPKAVVSFEPTPLPDTSTIEYAFWFEDRTW